MFAAPPHTALLLLVLLCPLSYALYEDQVGQHDWYHMHIGRVTSMVSDPSVNRRLVHVMTSSNVLASLTARSGDIRWRQVLPECERLHTGAGGGQTELAQVASLLVTASGDCSMVRGWNSGSGELLWETQVRPDAASQACAADVAHLAHKLRRVKALDERLGRVEASELSTESVTCALTIHSGEEPSVTVLRGDEVVNLKASTGERVWSWTAPSGASVKKVTEADKKRGVVLVTGVDGEGQVQQWGLSIDSGKRSKSADSTGAELSAPDSAVFVRSGHVIEATSKGLVLAHSSKAKTLSWSKLGFSKAGKGRATVSQPTSVLADDAVVVSRGARTCLVRVPSGESFCADAADAVFATTQDGSIVVSAAYESNGRVTVTQFSGSDDPKQHVVTLPSADPASNGLEAVFVGEAPAAKGRSAGSSNSPRILLVTHDHAVHLVRDDKVRWTREEALASSVATQFVRKPSKAVFSEDTGFPGFFNRLGPQASHFVDMVSHSVNTLSGVIGSLISGDIGAAKAAITSSLKVSPEEDSGETDDAFGFGKLIVIATEAGKVFGLDARSGATRWSRLFYDAKNAEFAPWKLVVLSHHSCALLSLSRDGKRTLRVDVFDPLDGRFNDHAAQTGVEATSSYAGIQHVFAFNYEAHRRGVLLVDREDKVQVFPATQLAQRTVRDNLSRIFLHVTNVDEGIVTGLRVVSAAGSTGLAAERTWTVAVPSELERISDVSVSPEDEAFQSSVRLTVRDGRTGTPEVAGLHKVINPNLFAVATVRTGSATQRMVASVTKMSDPSVTVYVIDGVTGSIVERAVHHNCRGPVHVVQTENVVAYHFMSIKSHQYEMSVMELYKSDTQLELEEDAGEASSWTALAPVRLSRSYVIGAGARALAVTNTRQGVTTKAFLLGLDSEQLLAVSQNVLDARRPMGEHTTAHKEARILPYKVDVPTAPQTVLSYTRTIARLHSIHAHHALLESFSLVLAQGMDLFFIRHAPASAFDRLAEDFNYAFLIVTVVGVAVILFVARSMARTKQLEAQWK